MQYLLNFIMSFAVAVFTIVMLNTIGVPKEIYWKIYWLVISLYVFGCVETKIRRDYED